MPAGESSMAFVMAIGNEVSGECVEAINVVVEVPKEEAWLCRALGYSDVFCC